MNLIDSLNQSGYIVVDIYPKELSAKSKNIILNLKKDLDEIGKSLIGKEFELVQLCGINQVLEGQSAGRPGTIIGMRMLFSYYTIEITSLKATMSAFDDYLSQNLDIKTILIRHGVLVDEAVLDSDHLPMDSSGYFLISVVFKGYKDDYPNNARLKLWKGHKGKGGILTHEKFKTIFYNIRDSNTPSTLKVKNFSLIKQINSFHKRAIGAQYEYEYNLNPLIKSKLEDINYERFNDKEFGEHWGFTIRIDEDEIVYRPDPSLILLDLEDIAIMIAENDGQNYNNLSSSKKQEYLNKASMKNEEICLTKEDAIHIAREKIKNWQIKDFFEKLYIFIRDYGLKSQWLEGAESIIMLEYLDYR